MAETPPHLICLTCGYKLEIPPSDDVGPEVWGGLFIQAQDEHEEIDCPGEIEFRSGAS